MKLTLTCLFLSLVVTGCSSGLSRSNAADRISKDSQFAETKTEIYVTGAADLPLDQMREFPGWRVVPALADSGYINVTPLGQGVTTSLTDKGTRESANWQSYVRPTGQTEYRIPVAKREVVEVTGVSERENTGEATFTWRWKSLNAIGKAMNLEGATQQGRAAFQKYDDGWRVTTVMLQ